MVYFNYTDAETHFYIERNDKMLDYIISTKEAAELTGYKEGYIKNLCADKQLPSKKLGNVWAIDRYTDEFLTLMEKRKLFEGVSK